MTQVLDAMGLKCPQPVLKVAMLSRSIAPGTSLEVRANCDTFPDDIQKWCADSGKVLISCVPQGNGAFIATIQF